MKELLLLFTCIVHINITFIMTKVWDIEYSYLGQRISLGFYYYLHIILESISSFREKYGSSLDDVTPLATLSAKDSESNANYCDGETI